MRLIDADAFKEAIKNDMYVVDYGVDGAIYGMYWSGIENAIDEQPSAEPDANMIHLQKEQAYMQGWEDAKASERSERKTGEWMAYNGDKEDWLRSDGTPVFMQCSECHAMVVNNFAFRWNFCPECGARMEVEE